MMTDSAAGNPPYEIVNPGEFMTGARPDGTFGVFWRVTIRDPDGTESYFDVNDEDYDPKTVHALAMGRVTRRAQIAALAPPRSQA